MRTRLGDDENKALANFIRTGDSGAVRSLITNDLDNEEKRNNRPVIEIKLPKPAEMRAVTDSTM